MRGTPGSPAQQHIITRADRLIRGLATVGIIAPVDKATDYQEIWAQHALATIPEKFTAQDLQPWTRPSYMPSTSRYTGCGVGQGHPRGKGGQGPRVMAHYTNNFVYERIAPGVLDELRKKNPTVPSTKRRKHKHHSSLP